ncbi:type II secretion system GspH family protein [Shewanella sp. AS16]|uniref:type II secretion system protein n=1 Tax=Shewanella sp. AS16 TaxID=2907625 RepID=UPI001F43B285|nr:type II secretion system protein [Shewanella sp. AS16]MCE9685915.1 type II secretion system GspH family protein [Shewanella sp. AS16]
MQKQQGFTLIELVVVIIILGILAVTAAPKFINLQGDARVSALQGLKGAIQGANSLVYSKAALSGSETGDTTVTIATGVTVATLDGYMRATEAALEAGMDVGFDPLADPQTTAEDWIINVTAGTPGTAVISQHGAPAGCFLTYTEATAAVAEDATATPPVAAVAAAAPQYVITATGC